MLKQQPQIVIIGAGYAGLLATVRLAGKLRPQAADITLVNASDEFVERLRLHQFAARQAVKQRPIVNVLRGTGVKFVRGLVSQLDAARRELAVQTDTGTQQFHYDYLLYALGSVTDRQRVTGVSEFAHTLAPGGPLSAASLRDRLPILNETGGRLVVVGGGATGVESAAEFAESYPGLHVQLVTRSAFGMSLGKPVAAYMRQVLNRLGVTVQDHTTVNAVRADALQTTAGTISYDLCLWTGGFVAPPLARDSGLSVNERGQILVDPFLRSISHPEIFAIGDAAHPVQKPGVRVRMSAFTATILGAHGADCLTAVLQGKTPQPLSFAYAGQGIALGRHDAIGFNNYPDDRPRAPYFTGRLGYVTRELFVRLLADAPDLERRWPCLFYWLGKDRYARMQRRTQRAREIHSPT